MGVLKRNLKFLYSLNASASRIAFFTPAALRSTKAYTLTASFGGCIKGSLLTHGLTTKCPGNRAVHVKTLFPGHALHEKGLQRHIAVGTLFNSQQRRALAVLRLNRWSTAGQPLVNRTFCSSTGLNRISFVRACEETFRTVVYGTLEG